MQDRDLKLTSGWPALAGVVLALGFLLLLIVLAAATAQGWMAFPIVFGFLVWGFALLGFMFNSPNQARVVQLFGAYVGTLTDVGFFWGNPLYSSTRVSLRVRTFETGVVETISKVTGQVMLRGDSLPVEMRAFLSGLPCTVAATENDVCPVLQLCSILRSI